MEYDYEMMMSYYNQAYSNNFWEDYKTLNYKDFYSKFNFIGGDFKEFLRGRSFLTKRHEEKDKDFKKWAYKACMREDIKIWRDNFFEEQEKLKFQNLLRLKFQNKIQERGKKWQQRKK